MNKKNILVMAVAMLLVAMLSVSGTLAWLTATTNPVTNTFAPSNIGLTLTETTNNQYKMVPGTTEAKNPTVTITGDVNAYLFVEVDEDWTVTDAATDTKYNLKNYIAYTLNFSGEWKNGDGTSIPKDVWYIEVPAAKMGSSYNLLAAGSYTVGDVTYTYAADTVAFRADVTKEMMALITESNYPTLTFKAYAVQSDGLADAAAAWAVRSSN